MQNAVESPLESIAAEVAMLSAPTVPNAVLTPTPAEIDGMLEEYDQAKRLHAAAKELLAEHKAIAIFYADHWGTVPANAKQSRRLEGKLHTLTVTRAESTAVNEPRIAELNAELTLAGCPAVFGKLFSASVKHKLLEGASDFLRTLSLPERMAKKLFSLYGQCFTVETSSPSVKVELRAAEKPAKRCAGKGGR